MANWGAGAAGPAAGKKAAVVSSASITRARHRSTGAGWKVSGECRGRSIAGFTSQAASRVRASTQGGRVPGPPRHEGGYSLHPYHERAARFMQGKSKSPSRNRVRPPPVSDSHHTRQRTRAGQPRSRQGGGLIRTPTGSERQWPPTTTPTALRPRALGKARKGRPVNSRSRPGCCSSSGSRCSRPSSWWPCSRSRPRSSRRTSGRPTCR